MKFFWPCFFPFGGEGETLFHLISDIKCTWIYMYLLFFTMSYSFFFLGLQEDDQMLLLFAMSYTGLSCNYIWLLWINQMVNKHLIDYENYLETFFAVWYEIVKSSVNVPYSRVPSNYILAHFKLLLVCINWYTLIHLIRLKSFLM